MPASHVALRFSYIFLCLGPFLAIAFAAIRALRIPGVYELIGGVNFAMFAIATWILARRGTKTELPEMQLAAIAGSILVLPFSLIALLWVGIGPPWFASPAENKMRYVVLVVMAAAVVCGCVALKEALGVAGERFYSTLGFAGMVLAGPFYLVGEAIMLAAYSATVRTLQFPDPAAPSTPWYTLPGFIAGIPAVPFIIPYLLGVISLRHSGRA